MVDVGVQGRVVCGNSTVPFCVPALVPCRADLPNRNHDVAIAVATEAIVTASGLDLIVHHVSCHRTIGSDEIYRFAVAPVTAPRWAGTGRLAIRGRVEVHGKLPALRSTETRESRAVPKCTCDPVRTCDGGVVEQ